MRKGMMTLEELLGTLLVIIGLVFIGIFLIDLYESNIQQSENNAQALINSLSAKIGNLEDGQNNTFALVGVSGWILTAWNKEVPIAVGAEVIDKDRKPQKCFDKSCICLCETNVANCQQVSYCRFFDRNVEIVSRLQYSSYRRENSAGILTAYCIPVINKLMGFFVDKKQNSILIYHDYGKQEETAITKDNDILTALSNERFLGRIRDNCKVDDKKTYEGIELPGM